MFAYHAPLCLKFHSVDVRWQKGYYHITIAFLDETPDGVDFASIIDKHYVDCPSFTMTFDMLDAFTTPSGLHFLCMKPSQLPLDFSERAKAVRKEIKEAGGEMYSEFMPHVTLGRVDEDSIGLEELRQKLSGYDFAPLTFTLSDIDYREFRGNAIYEKKLG